MNRRRNFLRPRGRQRINRTIGGIAALAVLALGSQLLAEPSAVMTSAAPVAESGAPSPLSDGGGEGSVSAQTGAFNYTYPIAVPPGRAGMAPSLGLSYSSDGASAGGIAAGWNLGPTVNLPRLVAWQERA